MKSFHDWVKNRSIKEGLADGNNLVANFKFNTDQDLADDHDKIQSEVIKIVFRKYPEDTLDFLNTLARRGDNELNSLLKKLEKGQGPRLENPPHHPPEPEEIAPNSADTGYSSGMDGDS